MRFFPWPELVIVSAIALIILGPRAVWQIGRRQWSRLRGRVSN